MDPLRNALSETLEMLRFTPSKGYFWEFKTKPSKLTDDEKPEDLEPNYLHVVSSYFYSRDNINHIITVIESTNTKGGERGRSIECSRYFIPTTSY
jgi:hypothetical protein